MYKAQWDTMRKRCLLSHEVAAISICSYSWQANQDADNAQRNAKVTGRRWAGLMFESLSAVKSRQVEVNQQSLATPPGSLIGVAA